MQTRKTVDQITALNADFSVIYSQWDNGSVYRRITPLWARLHLKPYVAPSQNAVVASLAAQGVEWVLAEHVSVTVSGTVYYTYETATGTVSDTGSAGCHNVENGGGYLPTRPFTRRCEGNHISCCILPTAGRGLLPVYSFAIATANDPTAAFSHQVVGLADTFIIGRL